MKNIALLLCLIGTINFSYAQNKKLTPNKQSVIQSVEKNQDAYTNMSNAIWTYAEIALKEYKSSKLLADYAEERGFKVKRGAAGMPTAFTAEFGSDKPIIGIMGEYDALPGISQKAQPSKEAFEVGGNGHGCGHNLFGVASLSAAIAIKDLIQSGKLKGTIRFYGTPAEESVGGKIYMARDGLFNDLDVCMDWHPDTEIASNSQSSQAMVDFIVEFKGKAAHAAYDPWNGRSAVDGAELFTDGVNMLREHVKPSVRMHYIIQNGGEIPNIVPEYSKVWMWVRDSKREGVDVVFNRIKEIAQGAALMSGTEAKITVQTGDYELLVNIKGAEAVQRNLELLGSILYTKEEESFAKELQKNAEIKQEGFSATVNPLKPTSEDPVGGSSDVGDVSWIVPEVGLIVTTAPQDVPWHSWAVVACGGMSIGHKGMLYAAKAMGLTLVDLYENESLRKEIRAEFEKRKGGHVFKAYIPDGPPPLPKEN